MSGLDQNSLKNYRPVYNLPFLSKCLERLVAAQMNDYLSSNDLYMKFQSAYRPFHRTEFALLKVQNDILCALIDKKDVILVLLDLSSAFDTLDHDVLLHNLSERFGFRGRVLEWFRSYLSKRNFKVCIDSLPDSDCFELLFGVPQGSVLGPILFTLYTSPLEELKYGIDVMLHADDSQLYMVAQKISDVTGQLKACLEEVREWMKSHLFILNDGKTEVVHFSSTLRAGTEKLGKLRIGECDITPSDSVPNLGVIFDEDGMMTSQIDSINKSAYYALYRIGKIRNLLDKYTTEKLVHAFVTSRLDYCNNLLMGLPGNQICKLQSVQNAAALQYTHWKYADGLGETFFQPRCHVESS